MADEKLTCTKMVRVDNGRDEQGKPLFFHERCGKDAAEYEIGGLLTKAKAVLCARHRLDADRENFISERGFPKGKITAKDKENGYQQSRLPGTGVEQIADE